MAIDCNDRSAGSAWFKSSHSGSDGGNCVEVAVAAQAVHVRDSKDRPGPQLVFGAAAWAGFLEFTGAR
ncbi:DUF397 domain-containing protein [Streptomyces tsukubensis]|uniref:DUF397 domain-containing protein n=2 Tax=Streptomyces tsukubensis TaxID=83656 RepID=A0A1V4A7H1_9ACTN|nr:DUF397 domain-containing protein [Streptomyces tsukubensis]OON77400.1 DUF397 domain-containing protein [Streptomyces tsukubensis]QFR97513.1 DUF397 domain-containing protein [Streptomyces tsukubensis]